MENYIKYPLALLCSLLIASCDKIEQADFRSMFLSYESADDRFEQSMRWNSENPFRKIVTHSDQYLIFSMSDSHVGETNSLEMFVNSAIAMNAAAMVMAGDLTTGRPDDYESFHQIIPGLDVIPSFMIAGNHDLYFGGWNEFYSRFGSSTYIFTVKTPEATDMFICFDTGGGTLGRKQMDWLRKILQNSRGDHRHCIVFTHNNFFRPRTTASTNPLVEELHLLLDLFTRYRVDMVVTGHDHKRNVQIFGSTMFITMDALKYGGKNSGYLRLFFRNGTIEYEFARI